MSNGTYSFMRDFVRRERESVRYERWFRNEVARGITEADAGDVLTSEEVEARFSARREALRAALLRGTGKAAPGG